MSSASLLAALQGFLEADLSTFDAGTLATAADLTARLETRLRDAQRIRDQLHNAAHSPCYEALVHNIYGTPLCPPYLKKSLPAEDHTALFTNVPAVFLDNLMSVLQPSFLVEVGSWKGGSAVRIARAATSASVRIGAAPPCLLCIDTWLGDGGAWIDRCTGWRDGLQLSDGLPELFWQFVANVQALRDVIVPWPIASLTALRALQHLVLDPEKGVPPADFVYLDASHEKGETLLEIRRAFELLRVRLIASDCFLLILIASDCF